MNEAPHIPVMLNEVLAALSPKDGEVYVDGTFGAGGYSSAFLDVADCTVIAIDRDRTAIDNASVLQEKYGDRLVLIHGRFGDALDLLHKAGYEYVDGFILDIGVSSMQIDQGERGFSFRYDAPLDMRMDQSGDDETAADVVNNMDEECLANVIYKYGEERHSRRVAKRIVEERGVGPITTTGRLADIVRSAVPKSKDSIDPATRTFQALRIYVNDELGELERSLEGAEHLLREGGRLVVVSFHSLEDKIVKKFLKTRAGLESQGSRHLPEIVPKTSNDSGRRTFTLPSRKAVFPSDEETVANPRARSARLRAGIRTSSSPWNENIVANNMRGRG